MSKSFLILGCGNMATALVEGLHNADLSLDFTTYTPSNTRAVELATKVSGKSIKSLDDFPTTDFLMVACKPQQFQELAKSLKGKISASTVVLSVLAGTTVSTIKKLLGISRVVRIMPNTPALVGAGVNAFYFDDSVESESKDYILGAFENFSKVFNFDKEKLIDTITPFSGSGPAYFFEFNRILIDYLIKNGVGVEDANAMMKATILGAAKLMDESSDSVETLRNKVTSKGGVTFEALEVFKKRGLEEITIAAIDAAMKRNEELSQE